MQKTHIAILICACVTVLSSLNPCAPGRPKQTVDFSQMHISSHAYHIPQLMNQIPASTARAIFSFVDSRQEQHCVPPAWFQQGWLNELGNEDEEYNNFCKDFGNGQAMTVQQQANFDHFLHKQTKSLKTQEEKNAVQSFLRHQFITTKEYPSMVGPMTLHRMQPITPRVVPTKRSPSATCQQLTGIFSTICCHQT